jgi:hypothetical protein
MSTCPWPIYVGLKSKAIESQLVDSAGNLVIKYEDGSTVTSAGFTDSLVPFVTDQITTQTAAMNARLQALGVSSFSATIGV